MEKSDSIKQLAVALVAAQAELKVVEKGAENPYFKSHYADLPAVDKEYKRVFLKHGLSVTQCPEGNGLRTTLLHTSGEYISSVAEMKIVKPDPQAVGSAITYYRRYALASVCGIVTAEDDDDGNAASDPKPEHKPEPKHEAKSGFLSLKQVNRLFAIGYSGGLSKEEIVSLFKDFGYAHSTEIPYTENDRLEKAINECIEARKK